MGVLGGAAVGGRDEREGGWRREPDVDVDLEGEGEGVDIYTKLVGCGIK